MLFWDYYVPINATIAQAYINTAIPNNSYTTGNKKAPTNAPVHSDINEKYGLVLFGYKKYVLVVIDEENVTCYTSVPGIAIDYSKYKGILTVWINTKGVTPNFPEAAAMPLHEARISFRNRLLGKVNVVDGTKRAIEPFM